MDRLPAYPLFLIDPLFSVWSRHDELNGGDTAFWTGSSKRMYGFVRADGKVYRFMGGNGGEKLEQTDVKVSIFETVYTFECSAFTLTASFVSPREVSDIMLCSMPIAYLKCDLSLKSAKKAEVFVFMDEECCYQDADEVKRGVVKATGGEAAFLTRKRQLVFSNSQDTFSADWGYVYLCGDYASGLKSSDLEKFFCGGEPITDEKSDGRMMICAKSEKLSSKFIVAFDDLCSIYYFGETLKSAYLTKHTIFDAINYVLNSEKEISAKLNKADGDIKKACGGKNAHYDIACASYRQSAAAHKLCLDKNDRVLFFSKECHSNGCMATVDVSYPSTPMYLLYNPELVWGMLEPVFDFAEKDVWEYDFAPHDVGTYPMCTGQTYGINPRRDRFAIDPLYIDNHEHQETHLHFYAFPKGNDVYELKSQMPVEECSNMIIMTAAANRLLPRAFTKERLATLEKWAQFLVNNGLVPSNQLCTDDFAGHLDKNANLSLKSIVGLGAYSMLLGDLGNAAAAKKYGEIARDYAAKWEDMCLSGREFSPLTTDGNGEYSLKYNLLFDKVLRLNLFSEKVYAAEAKAAEKFCNKYGAPLDERKAYTKSDWLMWMAAISKGEARDKIISSLQLYLKETKSRVPFSDWYDTVTGESVGFSNRTVQGGMFAVLLADMFAK